MCHWRSVPRSACAIAAVVLTTIPSAARAADLYVPAGGNLQTAINAAKAGDTIVLEPGATYIGNFKLPIHAGAEFITIRTAASSQLPPEGTRVSPAHKPYLATIKSPNTAAAMKTVAGSAYWRLLLVAFEANLKGYNDILLLGDGSAAQNQLSEVPHHLVVDRVYMAGDRLHGQKRGIALNAADVTIVNSHIVEMKAIGQDSQAIGGWNGPGPFRIENNHLEGSTEVFMLGGADPSIPNMTPSNLVFRGNTLTRPLSWRDPIVSTPSSVQATTAPNGSLAAGAYAYRVTARRPAGTTTAKSPASTAVSVTVADGSRVTITWDAVPDATDYVVYGRTPGAQNVYWVVTSTSFTDDGISAGTAGTPSSSGTMWQVKNLFELKHVSGALIAYNVMENNWAQAQDGTAILFTPRNSQSGCPWCVVENVTFEYNTVRHVGSGMMILGWDNGSPTRQTKNVVVRHNEFSDVSKTWGGSGYAFFIFDNPSGVTIDHNTVISPNGTGFLSASGRPAENFVLTNNVARHGNYGVIGTGKGIGIPTINFYLPGAVVTRNVFAGGKASNYPAGNEFPSQVDFEAHFTSYAAGDFTLVPGTNWERTGTDGLDLGADFAAVAAQAEMTPPRVTTTSLMPTKELLAYAATLTATGGRAPYHWTVLSGTLPAGLALDEHTGAISGAATLHGDYAFTVQVEDATGAIGTQPFSMHVDRAFPPVQILTAAIADAIETFPYSQPFSATGGAGTYVWSVASGSLPAGLWMSADGVILGTPVTTVNVPHAAATPSTYEFTVKAADPTDSERFALRSLALVVAPPPNQAPSVAMTAPSAGAVVPVGTTITLAAQTIDLDGVVERVDFYLGSTLLGSGTAPGFTMTWVVPTSGTYTFAAVAIDDEAATSASSEVTIGTASEIVLRASAVTQMTGNFTLTSDATAAGGYALWLVNKALAKVNTASAAPAHYAEFTFAAEAGRPYHLWIRGRAERNSYLNDSVFVQFDGVPTALIGTTSSMTVILEDNANAGVSGWGWQDNAYGPGVVAAPVVFTRTGLQTIRIQNREDGLIIDQVVLSPGQFLTTSPGTLKNDTTILP